MTFGHGEGGGLAGGLVVAQAREKPMQEFNKLVGLGEGVAVADEEQFHTNPMEERGSDGKWRRSAGRAVVEPVRMALGH